MRFSACFLATTAVFPLAANGSPASMLPSFLDPWAKGLSTLWRTPSPSTDYTGRLGKRQSTTAFDRNPNGSEFLWVLEDTYQGNTFFEYVTVQCVNETCRLTFPTVDGPSSREMIQQSESCIIC